MCGFLNLSGTTVKHALWESGHLPLVQSSKRKDMTDKRNETVQLRVDAQIEDDLRDVQQTSQNRQVTEFVDEEEVVKGQYKQKVTEVKNPYINQDLVGFLSRPYPIATISWKHSSTKGACIGRYVFPDASFKLAPLWQKLQHFQFFRAGMCFTIKVNASAYHYGKLLCVWRPIALGKTSNDVVQGGPAAAYDNLYTLSSFPHVIIDANGCESTDFYVDYSLPYDWLDLSVWATYNPIRKMMNLGILEFWVLNPLYAMGQSTDPDAVITVFASFTDPEVSGYTSQQHKYVDMGFFNGYKSVLMPNSFSYSASQVVSSLSSSGVPKAQSGRQVSFERIDEQSEEEDSGYSTEDSAYIREIVAALNRQAAYSDDPNATAPELPEEREGGLRRVARVWNNITRFFRGSLPHSEAGNDAGNNNMNVKSGLYKVSQYPIQVASTHVDHAAIPMALSQQVGCKDTRGTSENGIRSFLSKACLLHQFDITKTSKWGSTLMSIPVSPAWYPVGVIGSANKPVKFMTRVAMYSRLFTMWRGTLRYHFNIVCSRFHSLRVRVYWMPGVEVDNDKIFMAGSSVNKIIDVEGSTDFFIDVPWLNRLASLKYDESDASNNGMLYMDLLNPIVYPEANMPPVQVNVWLSAGPDFEVELLKKKLNLLNLPSWNKPSKADGFYRKSDQAIKKPVEKKGPKAQAGDMVDSGPIMGNDSKPEISEFVGERVMSIQDLITKPVPFHKFTVATNEISYVPNGREAVLSNDLLLYANNCLFDYFAVAFGAVSGAIRFHALTLRGGSIGFVPEVTNGIVFYRGKSGVTSLDDFLDEHGHTSVVAFDASVTQRTATMPYYSNCKYIPMTVVGGGGEMPEDVMFPMARIDVFAGGDGALLYASATENFYYHLPTGVPAMIE